MIEKIVFPLLVSLLSLFLVAIFQGILNRLNKARNPQLNCIKAMMLSLFSFLLIYFLFIFRGNGEIAAFLYYTLVFSFVSYSYFHFFNMSETSRRIRLIFEVANGEKRNKKEIEEIFCAEDMIKIRLERLKGLGQISEKESKFYPSSFIFPLVSFLIYTWSKIMKRGWPVDLT